MKEDYLYHATFRFYEELNDFLPSDKKKVAFTQEFFGKPTVKEVIESIGVPHPEIDLILVNGASVGFDRHLKDGDHIAVYPQFESFDISPIIHLRPEPLRETRFMADIHLGKLTRYLRLLGFDTETEIDDNEIIARGLSEKRIILTRDYGILKNRQVTHGYFIRHVDPKAQAREVIARFDLKKQLNPFTRCLECNVLLKAVPKERITHLLETDTRTYYTHFFQCPQCHRIYWEGSHHERMQKLIDYLTH